MEVSPKTFREVEFREKLRGYHPEDVDQFLEQMATGVEELLERLDQALQRAARAEAQAAESGSSDETLRRTLVLAQRTADQAVQEAREQAARLVGSAEQKAQAVLAEAEERARRLHNEALGDVRAELAKLEATRARSAQEVEALERWADEQRSHLLTTLQDAAAMLERGGLTSPPPASTPLEVPRGPGLRSGGSGVALSTEQPDPGGSLPPGAAAVPPEGVLAPPVDVPPPPPPPVAPPEGGGDASSPPIVPVGARVPEPEPPTLTRAMTLSAPPPPEAGRGGDFDAEMDEDAMDSFFRGDDLGEADDRRFGGRLRRRR